MQWPGHHARPGARLDLRVEGALREARREQLGAGAVAVEIAAADREAVDGAARRLPAVHGPS
ncbi:MAG: hypothetical protein R2724_35015 [Bryobacterales bacterium]